MDTTIGQQSFDRLRFSQPNMAMNPPDLSPSSFYDLQADFSADSAPSRGSPVSPVFGTAYSMPFESDWPAYLDKPEMSPDLDVFYGESFGGPMAFMSPQNPAMSPTANPLDLMSDNVSFGQDDLNDIQPLFQTPGGFQSQGRSNANKMQASSEVNNKARMAQAASRSPKTQTRSLRSSQRLPNRSSDLKRKTSESESASSSSPSSSPEPPARRAKHHASDPSKNPHNLIEKRYRVNINEKIVALRDAVPSLRCVVQQQQIGDDGTGAGDEIEVAVAASEELGGLMPARKLNKATILSKATEYIGHLEKKNDQLARENLALEKKLAEAQRWQRPSDEAGPYWA